MKSKLVNKPWGKEEIIFSKKGIQFKIITVNNGEMTSLQYHDKKIETILALTDFELVTGVETKEYISKGNMYVIQPTQIHRFMATQGKAIIAEMSRGNDKDIVRLADKYGRVKI